MTFFEAEVEEGAQPRRRGEPLRAVAEPQKPATAAAAAAAALGLRVPGRQQHAQRKREGPAAQLELRARKTSVLSLERHLMVD